MFWFCYKSITSQSHGNRFFLSVKQVLEIIYNLYKEFADLLKVTRIFLCNKKYN